MSLKDPEVWGQPVWTMVGVAALIAYFLRFVDRVKNRKVYRFWVETCDAVTCLLLSYLCFLAGSALGMTTEVTALVASYISHRGTRYIFSRIEEVTDAYIRGQKSHVDPKDE